ncbi:glycosyltransferase family 4 protein [Rosenbergiella australiborealis]|uniref:Glycosyltransferase family 4 protein n=1 Tax=Rosenbergiella australiborealis TaxID=1544696 RepID=A0ABS5T0U9_9GAMM|nr:glycosyltransferase family 4 protein [Rosenbergiella australiborealis]MBT0725978.1 glycosyltransferase family 4 protein [Rosenbergiella australiborealis]
MKIHYLITSLETGEAKFAIPDIVTALKDLGHDVSIIACQPRELNIAPHFMEAGLSYTELSSRRRALPIVLASYLSVIHRERPDIIWTSSSFGNLVGQCAGKMRGIPVISFQHSANVKSYTYCLRHCSTLWVGDSQTVVDYLQHRMHIPAERVMTWPLFQYNEQTPQAKPWDGQSRLQIGSVGPLYKAQQYLALIDALGDYLVRYPHLRQRIQLTILGDGPERERLEDKVIERNLQGIVRLPDFSSDITSFLSGLHLYVQPSDQQGMCLAVHEAMNVGLPIMARPVGEMRDAVQAGRTGFVLSGDLKKALASSLQEIFIDPSILGIYGASARKYVRNHFNHQQFTQAAERIIAQLPCTEPLTAR